jgi:transcriptional regulator with XRE-family HTH domain
MPGGGLMSGLGERLQRLRQGRGLTWKEVATRTGIPVQELQRLEAGARKGIPAEWLSDLANLLGTTQGFLQEGRSPESREVADGFLQEWDALPRPERESLRYAPIQGRIAALLSHLGRRFPGLWDREGVAAALGYTPDSLDQILVGEAPLQSPLLQRLVQLSGLPRDFFVRGDLFGGVAGADGIGDAQLRAYYEVVQEAARGGISPGLLRRAVRILALRSHDDPADEGG